MGKRAEILQEARKYLGVRFRHQGRSDQGLDCLGLVLVVINKVYGRDLEFTGYPKQPDARELRRNLNQELERIPVGQGIPGDVALLTYGGETTHLGFITDVGIIHATALYRKVVEHSLAGSWDNAIVAVYRLPGD